MMWADSHWLLSDDKEKLTWMVNDIIEELMDPDMNPKTGVFVVGEHSQR